MGNGDEVRLDYDKLNKVYGDLEDQKGLVESLDLGSPPSASAFGGSAKGEWLASAVIKGHHNIGQAKRETVEGLEKYASAVNDTIHDIAATDEGSAIVAKKMADALTVMSNPLVIFDSASGGKRPMAI